MTSPPAATRPPFGEFVALTALMMSLTALSIDAMLPALPDIGQDLNSGNTNANQLVITLLFAGMAVGQLLFGPLSDSIGRKPSIYIGLGLFMVGCVVSLAADSFSVMLIGRFLQGVGVAAPRTVSLALVRDQFEGNNMARVMSFIMAVFIFVPMIAPAYGQVVIMYLDWRFIFVSFLILGIVALIWFSLRQPETLDAERRVRFSMSRLMGSLKEIFSNRIALGYTIAAGFIFGAFLSYLTCSQQVFQEVYGVGKTFPLYFGVLAVAIGLASLTNGGLVHRLGMKKLARRASLGLTVLSIIFVVISYLWSGAPPLWGLMSYFLPAFFCLGIMFGNLNALAMAPLGHIAGLGATVIGSLSTFISVPLGTLVGQGFDGTVLPLIGGFALFSLIASTIIHRVEP
ncbi:MAG: multidrug effflux MFS transporter [Candidatus Latescibacteria bacterium]|nr:multidrug effflux MFS transporter [Candidatus Latescibacterota bacterium]